MKLQGFVLRSGGGHGQPFQLARMYITCCVADAIALSATVKPPASAPAYPKDSWIEVDGLVQGEGKDVSVRAARIKPIVKPRQPYLSFVG